jgi:hypothetical protein
MRAALAGATEAAGAVRLCDSDSTAVLVLRPAAASQLLTAATQGVGPRGPGLRHQDISFAVALGAGHKGAVASMHAPLRVASTFPVTLLVTPATPKGLVLGASTAPSPASVVQQTPVSCCQGDVDAVGAAGIL